MDNKHTYAVIMAGGVGSRFWPASTEEMPKQFLDITGQGKSLIQLTYERFLPMIPKERIIVITHKKYKDLVGEHLPDLDEENIVLEPSRNNTAPSVAYAAFHLKARDPEACMVVAPSDHIIEKSAAFLAAIKDGFSFVNKNAAILTLGMRPTRPDTGYGYIQYNNNEDQLSGNSIIFKVRKFTEKPGKEEARRFLASGDFVWNSGIFLFSVKTILNAYESVASDIYEPLSEDESVYGTAEESSYIEEHYLKTPNVSVDYAIMEKVDNIYTLPAQIGWSDLGTWGSVYELWDKNDDGVVIQHEGDHLAEGNKHSLLRLNDKKKVLIKGLEDFIVVDTDEALLIYPRDEEQNIKEDRNRLLNK